MLFLVLLPLVCSAQDPDLVGDIFGTQQIQQSGGYSGGPRTVPTETRCDELRPCVECSVFKQYWASGFSSAYDCAKECVKFSFVTQPVPESLCTLDYSPVCGIDGNGYSNSCSAKNGNGIGVSCEGECPCPSTANVCEFKGNLDGDTICKAYKFVIEEQTTTQGHNVFVFRPPCLADDLEVNGGIWNGETATKGYDTFPNGWGILTYTEEDHLNRDKYDGSMVYGVMQGYGTLFWKDGSYYSGHFVDNSKAGEGTLFYSNGDIFTGAWVDEKKTGEGKYMFSKGGEYSGGFYSGAQDGEGEFNILHPDDGAYNWEHFKGQYEGGYKKTGTYKLTAGDTYEGDFSSGLGAYGGPGKYIWACGKSYTGDFKSGQPDGTGVMEYPEGWRYEGQFKDGKFHGNGKFTWGPDNYYEGEFSGGEMTGNGLYYVAGGGLYDSSVGLYYPHAGDKGEFYDAHFDGKTLRYKKPPVTKGGLKKGY